MMANQVQKDPSDKVRGVCLETGRESVVGCTINVKALKSCLVLSISFNMSETGGVV